LAELRAAGAADAVADGEDGVEVVVLGVIGFAVGGSYPEFPDNCLGGEFTFFANVHKVFVDGLDGDLK